MHGPILIAPTAFKGTLSAAAAAGAMAAGARAAAPAADVRVLPLSDGGNGLLDALEAAGGRVQTTKVAGPLGERVVARYLVQDGRVVVETAEACGLHRVPEGRRDPMRADTAGVGELLLEARRAPADPADPLVVGLGGSATVDAGAGMARALGWRLLDERGAPVGPGGAGLLNLATIEPPAEAPELGALVVLADVTNPLVGPLGAARVYGPQKGATAAQVASLERGLERWAEVVARDLGVDVAGLPGGGAAGGLGAAFAALLESPPRPGAAWLLDAVGFDRLLEGAAVVVTGEGAWDAQSSMGKVTGVVLERCRAAGVPVVLVAGSVAGDPPAGVEVVTGAERPLDEAALALGVEAALGGLLARRNRP